MPFVEGMEQLGKDKAQHAVNASMRIGVLAGIWFYKAMFVGIMMYLHTESSIVNYHQASTYPQKPLL
jgi:hypothetical protein